MSKRKQFSDMPSDKRILVTLVKDICRQAKIQCVPLRNERVLRLEKNGRVRHIYGFIFDVNSAVALMLADDKAATYSVLKHCGIPVIEHINFLKEDPAELWEDIKAYFKKHPQGVVCKRPMASGGLEVVKAHNLEQLRAAVEVLLTRANAICLAPYFDIQQEYRVVTYQGEPLLSFSKQRPSVLGNAQQTLAELIQAKYPDSAEQWLETLEQPQRILALNEVVLLNWKHNLGLGAKAEIVEDPELQKILHTLARQTTKALNIHFASVDIVRYPQGFAVLEVNAGVMMENFASQGPQEYAKARSIYQQVLFDMMGIKTASSPETKIQLKAPSGPWSPSADSRLTLPVRKR